METQVEQRTETILIVDDDTRVVELLQITLGGRGYKTISAHDGNTALEKILRERPDLVVLDVRLPRKSGMEILDTVRRNPATRNLPVILISGDTATESRLQGLKLGADDYLAKPFSPRELIIKIRRILDRTQDHKLLLLKTEVLQSEVRRGRDTMLQMRQELGQNLNRMSQMLNQVMELNRYSSIDEILERFVIATVANLGFECVTLFVADSDGQLMPRVWRGVEDSAARELWLSPDGGVVRICTSIGRPLLMDEFVDYPDAKEEILRLSSAGIHLLSPAISDGRLCALLGLGERSAGNPVGRFDHKLLEILGNAITAALQNAAAFEKTRQSFLQTTAGLVAGIEDRYPFIRGHSRRVQRIALEMGGILMMSPEQQESLGYGALLHDLGQLEQYGELLDREVVLCREDRRRHREQAAVHAASQLGPGGQGMVGGIIRHHQEYWDGTGLPDGLRGLEIPLGARVVALANAYDALVHDRPHRAKYSQESALRIIRERIGRQFDPGLVPLLVQIVQSCDAEEEIQEQ